MNKKHLIITTMRSASSNYQRFLCKQKNLHHLGEIEAGVVRTTNEEGESVIMPMAIEHNPEVVDKWLIWTSDRGVVLKMFPDLIAKGRYAFARKNPFVESELREYYWKYIRTADVIHFLERGDLYATILSNYFHNTEGDASCGVEIKDWDILVLTTEKVLTSRAVVRYYRQHIKDINDRAEIVDIKTEDLQIPYGPYGRRNSPYLNRIPGREGQDIYEILHECIKEARSSLIATVNKPWVAYLEE